MHKATDILEDAKFLFKGLPRYAEQKVFHIKIWVRTIKIVAMHRELGSQN